MEQPKVGTVGWFDLTVPDAEKVRAFYERVVGWQSDAFAMDGYSDYCMKAPGGDHPVAGVCHARGVNQGLPTQWLIYITVADLAQSLEACVAAGGQVVVPSREAGPGRMAVIRDPAGAVCALYQSLPEAT